MSEVPAAEERGIADCWLTHVGLVGHRRKLLNAIAALRTDANTMQTRKSHSVPSVICRQRDFLFHLDARSLDDRPPFLGLGLVEGMKRFRGLLVARKYLLADVGEPLAYRRVGERGNHRGVELCDDLLRRALGNPQPVPE